VALRDRVEDFIAQRADVRELRELLDECSRENNLDALLCVRRLFEDMYGGFTFNFELKAPAAWELACWGERGLDQLTQATTENPTSKNVSLCLQILCLIAAGQTSSPIISFRDDAQMTKIEEQIKTNPRLSTYARSKLIDFVLSIEDEDDLVDAIGVGFSRMSLHGTAAAKELFAAVSTRWLAVSKPLLDRYETLIAEQQGNEPAFQAFFTQHPQILDPMAANIWPQPNLHGAREPDFVIHRSDNSYLVVEIETPAKQLVTQANQLAAPATHAVAQVTEYRRFIERLPNVQAHFPGLEDLTCLVVVGLERNLNDGQKQTLQNDNRQRHALRVVGFDWLAERARAIQENIVRTRTEVHHARVI
jgi:hypothetical protein